MKITGITVGTTLPKSNFDQTDPSKGDYIKGDRSFLTPDETLTQEGKFADAKAVGDARAMIDAKIDAVDAKIDANKIAIESLVSVTADEVNELFV